MTLDLDKLDDPDLRELRAHPTPLVVYVGAELPRAAGLPSRRELAEALVFALPEATSRSRRSELRALADAGALTDLFTELERDLGPARFGLEVERAMGPDSVEPPPLAELLSHLGPRIQGLVTPNLDRLLERAFESRLVAHTRPNMGLLHRRDWLLKLNGTLPERASWVLTREQHARVRHTDPRYAQFLRALFIGRSLLFVGTTVDDPIFDAVIDQIRGLSEGAPPRHWALLPSEGFTPARRAKLDDAGIAAILYATDAELLELLASLAPDPSRVPLPPTRPPLRPASGPLRILFACADPRDPNLDRLSIDREQRVIREAIARAQQRERIELETRTATCFADLSRALLEGRFDIVHIASHGSQRGLILDDGYPRTVPPSELAALFDEYAPPRGRLRCVVLNACWSVDASEPITAVPTVVAMRGTLGDHAALAFAEGFYDAVGAGRDFAAAHREGCRRARCTAPGGPFEALLRQQT